MKALIFMTLVAFAFQATAQTTSTQYKPQFDNSSYALTVGTVLLDVIPKDAQGIDYNADPGLSVGVYMDVPATVPWMDYQTGVFYTRTNTRGSGDISGLGRVDVSFEMERLSAPVFAKIYTKNKNFYFKGGAMTHFFLRGRSSTNLTSSSFGATNTQGTSNTFSREDTFRTFVADAVGGVGYHWQATPEAAVDFELNYQRSLWGVTKQGNDLMSQAFFLSMAMAL